MSQEAVSREKQKLRNEVLAGRKAGHDCGHAHSQLLIDYAWENRVKTVACYISFGDEPSTNVFLKHCQFDEHIALYVPRVSGDDLEWVLFTEDQARHPLGMKEPVGNAIELSEVDLMVIPGLAIDHEGNRLGRGKGYYDRALSKLSVKHLVGVVHDNELVDHVPTEGHDAKVQGICTCSDIVIV